MGGGEQHEETGIRSAQLERPREGREGALEVARADARFTQPDRGVIPVGMGFEDRGQQRHRPGRIVRLQQGSREQLARRDVVGPHPDRLLGERPRHRRVAGGFPLPGARQLGRSRQLGPDLAESPVHQRPRQHRPRRDLNRDLPAREFPTGPVQQAHSGDVPPSRQAGERLAHDQRAVAFAPSGDRPAHRRRRLVSEERGGIGSHRPFHAGALRGVQGFREQVERRPRREHRRGIGPDASPPEPVTAVERVPAQNVAAVGQDRIGQLRRFELELGHLDGTLEEGVSPAAFLLVAARAGAVPDNDPHVVRTRDDRHRSPEQERLAERRGLLLGNREEGLRPVFVEDDVRVLPAADLDGGDEDGAVAADLGVADHDHRFVGDLDRPVQVVPPGPRQHVVEAGAGDVVEEVIALHGAEVEAFGVAGVHAVGGRPMDLVEERDRPEGPHVAEVRALVGAEGKRRRGQLGTDLVELIESLFEDLPEIPLAERFGSDQQRLRAVLDRTVELHLARSEAPEEQQVEEGRHAPLPEGGIVVEPQLHRIEETGMGEVLLRPRRPEQDVEAAAVGAPTGPPGVAAVELVGVGDPGVVLLPVLVLGGARIRVAPLPERLDERVPEVFALKVEEGPALGFRDDVNHLLLQPDAVPGRHVLLGRGRQDQESAAEAAGDDREEPHVHRAPEVTVTGRPAS